MRCIRKQLNKLFNSRGRYGLTHYKEQIDKAPNEFGALQVLKYDVISASFWLKRYSPCLANGMNIEVQKQFIVSLKGTENFDISKISKLPVIYVLTITLILVVLGTFFWLNFYLCQDFLAEKDRRFWKAVIAIFIFAIFSVLVLIWRNLVEKMIKKRWHQRHLDIVYKCDKWNYKFQENYGVRIEPGVLSAWLELRNISNPKVGDVRLLDGQVLGGVGLMVHGENICQCGHVGGHGGSGLEGKLFDG